MSKVGENVWEQTLLSDVSFKQPKLCTSQSKYNRKKQTKLQANNGFNDKKGQLFMIQKDYYLSLVFQRYQEI